MSSRVVTSFTAPRVFKLECESLRCALFVTHWTNYQQHFDDRPHLMCRTQSAAEAETQCRGGRSRGGRTLVTRTATDQSALEEAAAIYYMREGVGFELVDNIEQSISNVHNLIKAESEGLSSCGRCAGCASSLPSCLRVRNRQQAVKGNMGAAWAEEEAGLIGATFKVSFLNPEHRVCVRVWV